MTPQEQLPSREDMIQVFRNMQTRMRNYAFHHVENIRPRTIADLRYLRLDENLSDVQIGASVDKDVLVDPENPRRLTPPTGPLLIYKSAIDQTKVVVVETPVLLLSDLCDIRKGAFGELDRLIKQGELEVTPRLSEIFERTRPSLCSDDPNEWRPAALELYDAFGNDILVALHGVRQCLTCEPMYQDGLDIFVPRLLYPRVSSLDSIELVVSNPESGHARLTEIITNIVSSASSLRDACASYIERLGFLPLARPYSMASVVELWHAKHPDTNVWTEIWEWVSKAKNPLIHFHSCSVFVLHPELVPEGKLPELWQLILSVIHEPVSGEDGESADQAPWGVRQDLARHYVFYLESHLPDNDGASISCFAWWLATQVASIFPPEPKSAKFYWENWIKPALDRSVYLWTTAMSWIKSSSLRSVTVNDSSPWATALMTLMVGKFEQVIPKDATPEEVLKLHNALIYSMLRDLPFSTPSPENPTYAQEVPQWFVVQDWAQNLPKDQRETVDQLIAVHKRLCTTDGLLDALKTIDDKPLYDQFGVGMALKSKAYIDTSIVDAVWELLKDPEWRRHSLDGTDERVLALLTEGFCLLGLQDRDKWLLSLPHYFAEICERITEDEQRRRFMFLFVIQASLAADTVSAVQRLVLGEKKALYAPFAKEYYDRIKSTWSIYPAWVQGRLRGMLASLNVS
jgi:hypothetical protein